MGDRLVFPDGFLWGAATSAYQIEGAVTADGRGPCLWDICSHRPGTTHRGDNGDIACDHYHRLESDVDLISDLSLRGYRFSVAWPRVQPEADGRVNQAGLDHYRRLLDLLLAKGVEPMVTLYHFDLPQYLQAEGGWTNRETALRFADYAGIVADALGDRVRLWLTINQPWVEAFFGYGDTVFAPAYGEIGKAVRASHHLLLGHGLATRAVVAAASTPAQVGLALEPVPVTAASDSEDDLKAAERYDEQRCQWFLEPVFHGRYPERLFDEYVRLIGDDFLHEGDCEAMNADLGLLALNYYSPARVAASPPATQPTSRSLFWDWFGLEEQPQPDAARTTMGWTIEPEGLTQTLVRLKDDYGDIPLYVTENGAAFYDYVDPEGRINDLERIEFLRAHFTAAHAAITQGVDLRGYFVWSLLDNFEWAEGYSMRFGLVFTDYRTKERILKQSAHFYRDVIAANAVEAL
jgi:beta-glucosidase